MKYIIIPTGKLVGKEKQLKELQLDPRKSADGTETILHVEHYDILFPVIQYKNRVSQEPIPYPYPTYESPSEDLDNILSSPGWNKNVGG